MHINNTMGSPPPDRTLGDNIILGFAVTMGLGVIVIALLLAIKPDAFQQSPRYESGDSDILRRRNAVEVPAVDLMDFSPTNFGGENSVGGITSITSGLVTTGRHEIRLDDEKTSGTTNQVVPGGMQPRTRVTPMRDADGNTFTIGPHDEFEAGPNGELIVVSPDGRRTVVFVDDSATKDR